MRVHGDTMILHGGLMGASWGPHEGLMRSDRGFMGPYETLMGPHDHFGCVMGASGSPQDRFFGESGPKLLVLV